MFVVHVCVSVYSVKTYGIIAFAWMWKPYFTNRLKTCGATVSIAKMERTLQASSGSPLESRSVFMSYTKHTIPISWSIYATVHSSIVAGLCCCLRCRHLNPVSPWNTFAGAFSLGEPRHQILTVFWCCGKLRVIWLRCIHIVASLCETVLFPVVRKQTNYTAQRVKLSRVHSAMPQQQRQD